MALMKCKECGKEVSTKAKECPNCGAPVKRSSSIGSGCLTIIAIFFVIGIIGSWFDNDKSYKSTKTQSSYTNSSYAGAISDLQKYGRALSTSTDGNVKFVSAAQTTKSPLNAFKLVFKTDHEALMSVSGAEPGNTAYYHNVGRTLTWSTKFCTKELKKIMLQHEIDLVSGDLANFDGETQSMSPCFANE
ncbi:zinc ribbon domain-containing protein [uncultured Desulfobacter sp.]|uniref:zinc ribbon domain-containing protein n=1 Tax=uncultured Desulfobacter sp. TaxID=240139 RepID=UPI0029F501E4|nr:zinc ribbon domain-containing protein [uncultured Desulfobacter sp.]